MFAAVPIGYGKCTRMTLYSYSGDHIRIIVDGKKTLFHASFNPSEIDANQSRAIGLLSLTMNVIIFCLKLELYY